MLVHGHFDGYKGLKKRRRKTGDGSQSVKGELGNGREVGAVKDDFKIRRRGARDIKLTRDSCSLFLHAFLCASFPAPASADPACHLAASAL